MKESFGIIIICSPHDVYLARGVAASVRCFMGDVPICFIYDGTRNLSQLARVYRARVINRKSVQDSFLRSHSWGMGFTKMIALWESPFRNFLLLDADTCVWGDVRIHAELEKYDFIIDRPRYEIPIAAINKWYFNTEEMSHYQPDFDFAGRPYVCPGVFFGTVNRVELEEYKRFFESWNSGRVFKMEDMGFFNFVMFYGQQRGVLRVQSAEIQYLVADHPSNETAKRFSCPPAGQIADPIVVHWAGVRKPSVFAEPETGDGVSVYFRRMHLVNMGIKQKWKQDIILRAEERFVQLRHRIKSIAVRTKIWGLLRKLGLSP